MSFDYSCQMCLKTIKNKKNKVEIKFFDTTAIVCLRCYKLISNFFYSIFGGWE